MTNNHSDWNIANQKYLSGMIKLLMERIAQSASADNNEDPFDFTTAENELLSLAASMSVLPAIEKLATTLHLSSFEKNIVVLCAGVELDADLGELLASLKLDPTLLQPTFGLALGVLPDAYWSAITPAAPLRYWRLIEINKTASVTRSSLRLDEQILHYITGISELHERFNEITEQVFIDGELVPSQKKTADDVLQTISRRTKDGVLPLIQLVGPDRFDKLNMAAYISSYSDSFLYSISAYALPIASREVIELARLWSREAALNNYTLFLDCSEFDSNDKQRLISLISFLENTQGLIFLHSEQWTPDLKRNKIAIDIQKPNPAEQLHVWGTMMGEYAASMNGTLSKLVSQFNFSSCTIRKAAFELTNQLSINNNGQSDYSTEIQKKIWGICCTYTRPQVDELAQRIEPIATWKDIVLPDMQKHILREISSQVRQRYKVYNEWGFASKGNRGLGISALFAGESGTGKTMAAEVLANELELDLYKIDLSKVVNKYIGETEKNLKKIFDAAEEGGAILLFDEADALFGKRSDVKDSHDRYSNIEVSYLLQRMEAYRGLAILTTNMKNAVDKAFVRRLRFIVHFQFPDTAQRAEIWGKVFPDKTPKGELDLEKLSRLSIAGGSIRNIAMNAAFIAAHENSIVQMKHILCAAQSEYDKTEKPYTVELKNW